jgi:hypothetical protein
MMEETIELLNFIQWVEKNDMHNMFNDYEKLFYKNVHNYLKGKILVDESRHITGIVLFNGPSRVANMNIFVLKDNKWIKGTNEDKKDLTNKITKTYGLIPKNNLNDYVGFIGFENSGKYMVYKLKDTTNPRSTGNRCDQSQKQTVMKIINQVENDDRFSKETKDTKEELCVRQEFTLRSAQYKEDRKPGSKLKTTYFLDTEHAIINEFEKKEK